MDDTEKKILIVLGGGLNKDGTLKIQSKSRYDKTVEIEGKYDIIICSSNKTYRDSAKNQKKPEALIAKEYLVSCGISEDKILLEDISKDTFTNAFYCRKIFISKFNVDEFTVLTSKFHILKTKYIFEYIFPSNKYEINFIEVEDNNLDKIALNNRKVSELELVNFYKNNLETTYNIKKGNMDNLEFFVLNINPASSGNCDAYFQNLTKLIESKIDVERALY